MPLAILNNQPITAREEDRPNLIKLENLLEHLEPSTINHQLPTNQHIWRGDRSPSASA
jgi:hypothetical protein